MCVKNICVLLINEMLSGSQPFFFLIVLILFFVAFEFVLGMQTELDIEKVCCNPFFPRLNSYS